MGLPEHRESPCEDTGEGGRPQVKERGLKRNQNCQCLDVGFLASRNVRKQISVV